MNIKETTTLATINRQEVTAVDARKLHEALGVKERFADWVERYTNKFVKNQDYIIFPADRKNPSVVRATRQSSHTSRVRGLR